LFKHEASINHTDESFSVCSAYDFNFVGNVSESAAASISKTPAEPKATQWVPYAS
jgi:hypothetical protein